GFGAKLFQVINANATDTSQVSSFQDGTTGLIPLKKQLLLDLSTLKIDLDNLEGLAFGPHLADGSPTLLLVSDDNFREEQITQFLLFRVNRHSVRATNLGEPV
ncbi:MAG: esterase-like activity of phytase family protein, partial [Microcystaceae cyanobacterium]